MSNPKYRTLVEYVLKWKVTVDVLASKPSNRLRNQR